MQTAVTISIRSADLWRKLPARIVLVGDDGEDMGHVSLEELAEAIAPFLHAEISLKANSFRPQKD